MMRRRASLAWVGASAALAALVAFPGAGVQAQPAEQGAALVAQVRRRLRDDAVVRGEFEQRKTVKGFKNPLLSRGDFLMARGRGAVWRTREPFASTLVVTKDRLLTRQADGSVVNQLDARNEPALRAINETLFALLASDLQALEQRFRIEGELQGGESWRLTLQPREAALARWLGRIEMEGDRFVRAVRLFEAQGDASAIRFSQHASADALTREEEGRFE
jgi:hypothetical protein